LICDERAGCQHEVDSSCRILGVITDQAGNTVFKTEQLGVSMCAVEHVVPERDFTVHVVDITDSGCKGTRCDRVVCIDSRGSGCALCKGRLCALLEVHIENAVVTCGGCDGGGQVGVKQLNLRGSGIHLEGEELQQIVGVDAGCRHLRPAQNAGGVSRGVEADGDGVGAVLRPFGGAGRVGPCTQIDIDVLFGVNGGREFRARNHLCGNCRMIGDCVRIINTVEYVQILGSRAACDPTCRCRVDGGGGRGGCSVIGPRPGLGYRFAPDAGIIGSAHDFDEDVDAVLVAQRSGGCDAVPTPQSDRIRKEGSVSGTARVVHDLRVVRGCAERLTFRIAERSRAVFEFGGDSQRGSHGHDHQHREDHCRQLFEGSAHDWFPPVNFFAAAFSPQRAQRLDSIAGKLYPLC